MKSDLRVNEPLVPYSVNCGRYYIGGTWNPTTLLVKWVGFQLFLSSSLFLDSKVSKEWLGQGTLKREVSLYS